MWGKVEGDMLAIREGARYGYSVDAAGRIKDEKYIYMGVERALTPSLVRTGHMDTRQEREGVR